jgi:hypothetical protein
MYAQRIHLKQVEEQPVSGPVGAVAKALVSSSTM